MYKQWINHPVRLRGNQVVLEPLALSHAAELISLARSKNIWTHYALDGSNPETLNASFERGIAEREKGIQYPFTIKLLAGDRIIGSTRYLDIVPEHKKLEIGWTWLHPDYWGKGLNTECKLLLLSHSFEELGAERVQLKTDENNIRSRKAIEKIGGQFEGIFRNDMVRENGTNRNSAYYSIILSEWEQTKNNLLKLLDRV
jgi:RimJ/RimL family protein N-acetyltransferase